MQDSFAPVFRLNRRGLGRILMKSKIDMDAWQVTDARHYALEPPMKLVTPPLLSGVLYRFTFRGSYTYREPHFIFSTDYRVDALYRQSGNTANAPERHQDLLIDDMPIDCLSSWHECGALSIYSGIYEGRGQPVELSLKVPTGFEMVQSGAIEFTIERLPDNDPVNIKRAVETAEAARRAMPSNSSIPEAPKLLYYKLLPTMTLLTPALPAGLYRFTFNGVYRYDKLAFFVRNRWMDALYYEGSLHTERHKCLLINGLGIETLMSCEENGATHVYTGLYEAKGASVQLSLKAPKDWYRAISGSIAVLIEHLENDDPLVRRWAAERAQEAQIAAQQRKQYELDHEQGVAAQRERAQQAAIRTQQAAIEKYRRVVRNQRNFLDEKYRNAYVQRNQRRILTELGPCWQREYDQLLSDEHIAAIRAKAPEVLTFYELRLDMYFTAERQDVFRVEPKPIITPPPQSYYAELKQKLKAGENVPIQPLRDRIQDLYRQKIILEAKRRDAVRHGRKAEIREIDAELEIVRREITDGLSVIEARGHSVDFGGHREREESMEETFFQDYRTEQRIIAQLTGNGDLQTAEAVKALYAERRAKLFQQDAESYT